MDNHEICLTGECTSPSLLLQEIKRHDPHVLIIDFSSKAMDVIPSLLKSSPNLKIILVSASIDLSVFQRCVSMGISGYVMKHEIHAKRLYALIKLCYEGGFSISPALLNHVLRNVPTLPVVKTNDPLLTKRERQVLQLLADGNSYKGISYNLQIHTTTVSTHLQSIYDKLCVSSKSEAVVKALRTGIV